jgi:DNA-binding transcriptional ArsR family regulator
LSRARRGAKKATEQQTLNCSVDILANGATLNRMVESLDAVFHALSSEPRRALLGELAGGERTVGDLASPFEISLAAVSKHLKVLESAGLVERHVKGRTTVCRLRAEPLAEVRDWVSFYESFWTTRLDRLAALLTEEDEA